MATTHFREEAVLGPVWSVVLDCDETGGRPTQVTFSLNVVDGWVHERKRDDESGQAWEVNTTRQSRVGEVLDAAPGCAQFIAEAHMQWVRGLKGTGRAQMASGQRRALDSALRRHGLVIEEKAGAGS